MYLCDCVFQGCMYTSGGRIGFFQGDVKLLMDDIKELQPTVFPSVPRLLNRVYDKVKWNTYVTDLLHYQHS